MALTALILLLGMTEIVRGEGDPIEEFDVLLERLVDDPSSLTSRELMEFMTLCERLARAKPESGSIDYTPVELMDFAIEAAEHYSSLEGKSLDALALAHSNKAEYLKRAGERGEARSTLEAALDRCRGRSPQLLPKLLTELAALVCMSGELGAVLPLLEEAESSLDLGHGIKHRSIQCRIFGERGRYFQRLGNLDRAQFWFEQEDTAAKELPFDRELQTSQRLNRVRFYMARRLYPLARDEIESCLAEKARLLFLPSNLAELELYRDIAELRKSEIGGDVSLEQIRRVIDRLENPALLSSTRLAPLLRIVWLLTSLGYLEEAEECLAWSSEIHDSLTATSTRLDAGYRRAFYDATASHFARARVDASRGGDKSHGLAHHLNRCEQSFEAFLDVWRSTPLLDGGVAFLQYRDQARIIGELLSLTMAVHGGPKGVERALSQLIRAQSMGTLDRYLQARAVHPQTVQTEFLGESEGMFILFPSPDESHVFLIDKGEVEYFRLETNRDEFQRRTSHLLSSLRPRPGDTLDTSWKPKANELARCLLPGEVQAKIATWDAMTVVGEDQLGWIPMSCLPFHAKGKSSLGQSLAISSIPSIPVAISLSRASKSHSGLEDGNETDFLLILGEEFQAVGTKPWADVHANVEVASNIGEDSLEGVRVLQFMAHGDRDISRERPAVIVLESGNVTCSDVEKWANPPLVILTVCRAGRGYPRRGDAAVGSFSGAFLKGGALTVLVSAEKLDTQATLELMGPFHAALRDGDTVAQALQHAREKCRFADPSGDAFLRIVGLGNRPLFPRR